MGEGACSARPEASMIGNGGSTEEWGGGAWCGCYDGFCRWVGVYAEGQGRVMMPAAPFFLEESSYDPCFSGPHS